MSDDVCVKSMEQFTSLTFSDACREIANNPYSPIGGQVLYNHSRKSELPGSLQQNGFGMIDHRKVRAGGLVAGT